MTVATGDFAVLRRSFGRDLRRPARPGHDHRVLLRRAARGARRLRHAGRDHRGDAHRARVPADKAASVALVANTAPVAFGAIAIPIVTLAEITGLPKEDLGAMVGRQTPLLALFVPLILVGMVDGMRGIRQTWPAAVVGGLVFAIAQFATLELHLRRAHRHRRVAPRDREHRPAAARVAALRAAARRGHRAPPRRRPRARRRRGARPGVRGATSARQEGGDATRRARSPSPTRRTSSSS